MSYTTINQATNDAALVNRVLAAVQKEAIAGGDAFKDSQFGTKARDYPPEGGRLVYPVAIDNEAAYQYAVESNNPNPGGDVGVITDANIQAAVQTHWPFAEGEGPVAPEVANGD